jgi:hypothetical protein
MHQEQTKWTLTDGNHIYKSGGRQIWVQRNTQELYGEMEMSYSSIIIGATKTYAFAKIR